MADDQGQLPVQWADSAQFWAQPVDRTGEFIVPKVYLLSMNSDPLGDIAAMNMMYRGEVCRDLGNLTNAQRQYHWNEVMATYLKAPLESVLFHFLIESVDRSLTHQAVRQRTATYAQESLRFSVKGEPEFLHPPSIAILAPDDPRRLEWETFVADSHHTYLRLVGDGIPSEDARSVLPGAIATRYHYVVNLRNIATEAGSRLCTQAQFIWRYVFAGIVGAIREYRTETFWNYNNGWQFETIASSLLFRPVCYQIGKCPWRGETDRPCAIKSRVDDFAGRGIPSSQWEEGFMPHEDDLDDSSIAPIRPEEWLLDPNAART